MAGMSRDSESGMPFMKMHGLGNDFVVIDRRAGGPAVTAALVQAVGNRHRGVGFDQLAVIEADDDSDARLVFFNSDGSPSATCGNATRCIARYLLDETGRHEVALRTERGLLRALDAGGGLTSVNMGAPILDWQNIPLSREVDIDHLPIDGDPVATGMGNPHGTFFVEDAEEVDVAALGAATEYHELFPKRTNVQFANVTGPDRLRMRVWERGEGITQASGSSSCAVAVAAARRGLTGRKVKLELDGGMIEVDWRDDGVWMTGPTSHVFSGTFTKEFLDTL